MAVKNILYLDIETQNLFDHVGGRGEDIGHWLDPEFKFTQEGVLKLKFGIGATYDNQGLVFWADPGELLAYLLDPSVDQIVHFNGNSFDVPMLIAQLEPPIKTPAGHTFSESFQQCFTELGSKSLDLLAEIERVLNYRISLDSIMQGTLQKKKTMSGADWWPAYISGDIIRQTLATNYLMADVLDLYKIHGIIAELGQLAFINKQGQREVFTINLDPIPF